MVPDLQGAETDTERTHGGAEVQEFGLVRCRLRAVKYFGARMQSTLITFKGATETARSVGDTEPSSIAALLNMTL